jgi:hypothetical protein
MSLLAEMTLIVELGFSLLFLVFSYGHSLNKILKKPNRKQGFYLLKNTTSRIVYQNI